jgi:hypothetical protein
VVHAHKIGDLAACDPASLTFALCLLVVMILDQELTLASRIRLGPPEWLGESAAAMVLALQRGWMRLADCRGDDRQTAAPAMICT